MRRATWANLKAFVNARASSVQYIDEDNKYYLWANDGILVLDSIINKDGNSDQIDFETNYKASGNKKIVPDTDAYSNTDQFKAACIGFTGTGTLGQSTNIDFALTDVRYLVGVSVILKNQAFGDKITFQIVHPLAGVLSEFATNWNVSEDAQDQGKFEFPLRAKLPAGLIVRLIYNSIGSTNVSVACNLIAHQKSS